MHRSGTSWSQRKSARGEYGAEAPKSRALMVSIQIVSPQMQHDLPPELLEGEPVSRSLQEVRPRVLPGLKRFPFLVPKLLVSEGDESHSEYHKRTASARRNSSVLKGRKRDTETVLFPSYLRSNSIFGVPLCPALVREARPAAYVKYFSPKAEKARMRSPQRWDTQQNEGLLLVNSAFRAKRRSRRSQSRVD